MKEPNVVRLDDGTPVVELRRYLEERAERTWPPQRTGRRGRPQDSGLGALARAMGLHRTRLSHILSAATTSGRLPTAELRRIAKAFGDETLDEFRTDYLGWWNALTTKEQKA